ncbi:MAG: alcohol-forming fatty acyl-CoA reductase [Acidimicrobiaceae bacterium]|jgi:HAD superfamily hydrolase (TIGR01490 family)|nr:alcohol-forming fatty acyl-CoA reductase [Acidimicrobiaceae bacterium]
MIREGLAGKRVLVTGATGFLGTALVERLLRCVPDVHVTVLVRSGRRTAAAERTRREILRNDCFDRLRAEVGPEAFDALIRDRLHTVAGDVGQDGLGLDDDGRRALGEADIVIHSAATVSFDAALDAAVEVNLLGPSRVAEALEQTGNTKAHLVAVSTAYVAGTRRGPAHERPLTETPFSPVKDIDWRTEVDAARRSRQDADTESRRPERLSSFTKQARHELGAASTPLIADRAERLRTEWVADQLVEQGRARAQSLGWPDAYAYTKALGEKALFETTARTGQPTAVVRPSIIESALAEPRPGWIRGFRMAEPVIISYGRGLLKEFPGIPEGVVDVIPVDLVVAAIIAVAATREEGVFQVASGARNPLRYRGLVDLVREWFTANPLYDAEGQPIVVPEWSFPGRGRVQRQLERATKTLAAAEKVLTSLPVRGRRAQLSGRLEERRTQADRALGYVRLYGAYTETEAVFQVDRLIALWSRMDAADQAAFGFDPALVGWRDYVHDIHLPSIVVHARVRTAAGRKQGPTREERGRKAILDPKRHLAVFDLENTLIASNVVESYAWLATRHLPTADRARFVARTLREAPALLALDRRDRGDFLRHFYRHYEGAPAARLHDDAWDLFAGLILTKSFPAGIRRVREHRARGHRTLLITGALDFVIAPLEPLFDDVVAAHLTTDANGRLTGELQEAPPTGEARAIVMQDYADAHGLDLEQAVAYADSASDLPMLEAVGHPVAVNPEAKLATIARKRGWHVEQWDKSPGGPRPLLPIGARAR